MPKRQKKDTPGQRLWLGLYRADLLERDAETIAVPSGATRTNPERVMQRWLRGMSRQLKKSFPAGLRKQRKELGLTQQKLADRAGLTVTAVAMIERGERAPSLDTAARLCWALDAATGVTLEELT